jgi:hypothetical protein
MDDEGNGYDAMVLTNYRAARQQVRVWATEYGLDVEQADLELADYFAACDPADLDS